MRKRLNKLASRLPKWKRIQNRMMLAISAQIADLIDKKFKTRKEFADLLGKKESELSKWLSGNHNFTLKSLAKIEASLGEQFIFTSNELSDKLAPYKSDENKYSELRPFLINWKNIVNENKYQYFYLSDDMKRFVNVKSEIVNVSNFTNYHSENFIPNSTRIYVSKEGKLVEDY